MHIKLKEILAILHEQIKYFVQIENSLAYNSENSR